MLVVQRWVHEVSVEFFRLCFSVRFPWLSVRLFLTPMVRRMARAQGMGRHTKEEVLHIARRDLAALSAFIGESLAPTDRFPSSPPCHVQPSTTPQLG